MNDAPNLPIGWDSRWRGFVVSIPAVLPLSLNQEPGTYVATGITVRGPLASLCLHVSVVFAWVSLSPWFAFLFPRTIPLTSVAVVVSSGTIYYFPSKLPETYDRGGSESGTHGAAGGKHAFYPRQTIHIARAKKLVDTLVDAPKLNLPPSQTPVANLLAFSATVPRPPAYGLRRPLSAMAGLGLTPTPVPPAPDGSVARSLRALPELRATLIPPSAPKPVPQSEIRNALARARGNDIPVAAPAMSTATKTLPKLVLQPGQSVPPSAPLIARGLSEFGSLTPDSSDLAAPPQLKSTGEEQGAFSDSAHSNQQGEQTERSWGGGTGEDGGGDLSTRNSQGLIVSGHPSDKLGIPPGDGTGLLVVGPTGTVAGFGGSSGGSGIAHGSGPGTNGRAGGPGAGIGGSGPDLSLNAKDGLSTAPGLGGAGQGTGKGAFVPGVTIQGGVITLPSFASGSPPTAPDPALTGPRRPPALVVIATSRSGGGMKTYGVLKGSRVYTIYIDTRIGSAVLEYSDPSPRPGFDIDLTAPEPMRTELPAELTSSRIVIKFLMDKLGHLRELRVLESQSAASAALVVTALESWRFRPVLRGNAPIDVEAILGFGITTR